MTTPSNIDRTTVIDGDCKVQCEHGINYVFVMQRTANANGRWYCQIWKQTKYNLFGKNLGRQLVHIIKDVNSIDQSEWDDYLTGVVDKFCER